MMTVSLSGGKAAGRVARVDDGDYDLVMPYRWFALERIRPGHLTVGPYAIADYERAGRSTTIYMHVLITGWPRVDHEDHDGLNNQRGNLRPADAALNGANRRPQLGGSSPYKGVTWHKKQQRWIARIRIDGSLWQIGSFADELEAAHAYDAAALTAWGEYAYLNFPHEHR